MLKPKVTNSRTTTLKTILPSLPRAVIDVFIGGDVPLWLPCTQKADTRRRSATASTPRYRRRSVTTSTSCSSEFYSRSDCHCVKPDYIIRRPHSPPTCGTKDLRPRDIRHTQLCTVTRMKCQAGLHQSSSASVLCHGAAPRP